MMLCNHHHYLYRALWDEDDFLKFVLIHSCLCRYPALKGFPITQFRCQVVTSYCSFRLDRLLCVLVLPQTLNLSQNLLVSNNCLFLSWFWPIVATHHFAS